MVLCMTAVHAVVAEEIDMRAAGHPIDPVRGPSMSVCLAHLSYEGTRIKDDTDLYVLCERSGADIVVITETKLLSNMSPFPPPHLHGWIPAMPADAR